MYAAKKGIAVKFPCIAIKCIISYVTLCVGGSKAIAEQYILYCPATREMSLQGNI